MTTATDSNLGATRSKTTASAAKARGLSWWAAIGIVAWLAAVGWGMLRLAAYANGAGASGAPADRAEVLGGATHGRCRLLMFAHPHCPCTKASLGELARIMASSRKRLEATVYFYLPEDGRDDWADGSLRDAAAAIPGVQIATDRGGETARQFGAMTSGDVLVFDDAGQLKYHGGITAARGHEGDNRGRSAVTAIVAGERNDVESNPVFGCALFAEPDDVR